MIPKRIFQTYKFPFDELSDNAHFLIQEWKKNNPDYEYLYYSDKDIEDFILKEYGHLWHKRYKSLKYPVMKADVFRVLVVYMYGGFYADLDLKSMRSINILNNQETDGVIGIHNYALFFHPFFGFSEKHPLMEHLVNSLAFSIDNNKIEYFHDPEYMLHQKHYVNDMHRRDNLIVRYIMDVTGPLWWSETIVKYFGEEEIKNLYNIYYGNISKNLKHKIKQNRVVFYIDQLENGKSPKKPIYWNLDGSSNNFYGQGYNSWFGLY
jgi:mannosyltransferase OCH1-like enzyme